MGSRLHVGLTQHGPEGAGVLLAKKLTIPTTEKLIEKEKRSTVMSDSTDFWFHVRVNGIEDEPDPRLLDLPTYFKPEF